MAAENDAPASSRQERLDALIDRLDLPMLVLAGVAVAIYLLELLGTWQAWGVFKAYQVVALLIDATFVVDLIFKLYVRGTRYLKTPWFVIDFVSALPILSSLSAFPSMFEALRFIRGVRLFRMLRVLRTLRVFRTLRVLELANQSLPEDEGPSTFERVLLVGVLAYTVIFVGLMALVNHNSPPGEVIRVEGTVVEDTTFNVTVKNQGQLTDVEVSGTRLVKQSAEIEFFLVLGSILGMILIVILARAQIPEMSNKQVRALLNVALPHQVAEHFLAHPDAYDRTVRMPATVVFCDIEGFTSTVERIGNDLDALKHHLERAMEVVVAVHRDQDLIVDKFIGDAIMSFRGGDLVEGDPAEHAYRVARATVDATAALDAHDNPYFHKMRVGGASSDHALIGTFGTSARLSYTILGDRVNLAARLEAACKATKTRNLFCERTWSLTQGRDDLAWRRVGRIRVQGKRETLAVFEALDAALPDLDTWLPRFHDCLLYTSPSPRDRTRARMPSSA